MGDESMGPEGPAPDGAFADGVRVRYVGRGEDRTGTIRDSFHVWGRRIYFVRLDDRPDLLRPAEGHELRFLG